MSLSYIPNPLQSLVQTRDPIRNNFITIDTSFDIDHISYNTAGQGKHNKITMPTISADPTPGYATTEVGFFNKVNALTTRNEIYAVQANNLSYPITAWNEISAPGYTKGYSYLPTGFIMKWGRQTILSTAFPQIITYGDGTFPVFSNLRSITCNCIGNNAPFFYLTQITQAGAAQFTVELVQLGGSPMASFNIDISWVAIGE